MVRLIPDLGFRQEEMFTREHMRGTHRTYRCSYKGRPIINANRLWARTELNRIAHLSSQGGAAVVQYLARVSASIAAHTDTRCSRRLKSY